MDTIIDSEELKEARTEGLDEIEKITRQIGKRADKPAQRQAMAEIEEIIRRAKEDWKERGLLAAA